MSKILFDEKYKGLNKAQKEAVDAIEGPVMVNAGPGTGKTQILTLRIANILKKTDVEPENILALTFTNSGVFAMRDRLHEYIGDTAYRVNIFTFHAFCEHLIKNFSFYFPSFDYAKVIDDLEKVQIIEEIIDKGSFKLLTGTNNEYQKVRDISDAVSSIKSEGISVDEFEKLIPEWKKEMLDDSKIYYVKKYKEFNAGDIKPAEKEKIERTISIGKEIYEVYKKYQEKIIERKLYDFSDMVLSVIKELRKNENLKIEVQEQYQYVLVDEHQDTNSGQNELIDLLTDAEHLDGHPNIFTVGDEKQSIYRFQGASEETFKHFNEIFRDIKHIDLIENYRSTQTILDSAFDVIENSIPNSVKLHSNIKENNKVLVGEFSNYKFELMSVVWDIKQKLEEGVDPREIAILFRSNKHTDDIKNVLANSKIPFTVHSKNSIFDDLDISNIILLLKVVVNPNDEESLGKSLFVNFLGLDGYDSIKILQKRYRYKKSDNKNLLDMLSSDEILKEIGVEKVDDFINFSNLIKESIVEIRNSNLIDFLKNFLEKSKYSKYMLSSDLSRDKLLTIDKLFDEVKKQKAKTKFEAFDFLKMVDSYHSYRLNIENSDPEIEAGVQLMTAHGSKGKEFEYVYMINVTSKNWEKNKGGNPIKLPIKKYGNDINDERRLFYVSMTRAKKGLSITYSKTDWEGKEQEKSRFIGEISESYIENIDTNLFEINNIDKLSLFIEPQKQRRTIYDKDFIKEQFFNRGLTVTALNNYLDCPIKYFYRNLIQLPSGYSSSLRFGDLMHGALEKFFMECKREEKILGKVKLLEFFVENIENSEFDGKELEKYKERGLDSLSGWFDQYEKDLIFNVSIEQKIKRDFTLDSGEILNINGKLDKIEFLKSEMEGPIRVIDYKTGKSFAEKDKARKEDLERQIKFYYLLLEDWRDGSYKVGEASLLFLEKNKKGKYEKHSIDVNEEDILLLKDEIQEVAKEIISGEFLNKGCGKKDCEFCNLRKILI